MCEYAAAIRLIIALGVCLYHVGIHHGSQVTRTNSSTHQPPQSLLEQQLSDARHERTILYAESEQHAHLFAELRGQLSEQSAEIARVKETEARLGANLRNEAANKDQVAEEGAQMAQQLAAAEARADRSAATDTFSVGPARLLQEKSRLIPVGSMRQVCRIEAVT